MSTTPDHNEPPWPLTLDHQVCFALHSTSLMMTKAYKPLLQKIDLTFPQYLVMMVLWEEEGLTVGMLSKRLLTDPGSLTPLLKRLEAEKFITRQRSKQDERVVELRLTEQGRQLKEQARDLPNYIVKASGMPYDALRKMRDELITLRTNLQKARIAFD